MSPIRITFRCIILAAVLIAIALPAARGDIRPQLALQIGHTGAVTSVAFAPDGASLVSGSDDGTVKLWDGETGEVMRTLSGHRGRVAAVEYSPGGSAIASAGSDHTVRLWDARTGELTRTLRGTAPFDSAAFTADGAVILAGSAADGQGVSEWDARTGAFIRSIGVGAHGVSAMAVAPDGSTVATAAGSVVSLWTLSGKPIREMAWPGAAIGTIAYSPDGVFIAAGHDDGGVRIWAARTGATMQTISSPGGAKVSSIAFSPDTALLVTASLGGPIAQWDVKTGTLFRKLGYGDIAYAAAYSPDGSAVATGSWDKTISLWDAGSGKLKHTLAGITSAVESAAYSPDGACVASGSTDSTISLWNARTGELSRTLTGHGGTVACLAFSPDGAHLASGSDDKTIRLWDSATGNVRRIFTGHRAGVVSIAFSPDGETLASGDSGSTIKLWNVVSGSPIATVSGSGAPVTSLAFSPNGRLLASAASGGVRLWDAHSSARIRTPTASDGAASIAFSPDGMTLAGGTDDGSIKLLDALTGRLKRTFAGSGERVVLVHYSRDGSMLDSIGADGAITLRDAHTGAVVRTIFAPGASAAAFSPNAPVIAAGGAGNTVALWSASTGQALATLTSFPPSDPPAAAAPIAATAKAITVADKDVTPTADEWFDMTPDGWCDCSTNAAKYIRWLIDGRLYPAQRYYRRVRSPRMLRLALAGQQPPAPKGMGDDIPPEARFVALEYRGPSGRGGQSVTVTLEVSSFHNVDIKNVSVLVNGRPLPPGRIAPAITGQNPAAQPGQAAPAPKGPMTLGDKSIALWDKGITLGDKPIDIADTSPPAAAPGEPAPKFVRRFAADVPLPPGTGMIAIKAMVYDDAQLGSGWVKPRPIARPGAAPAPGRLLVLAAGLSSYLHGTSAPPGAKLAAGQFRDLQYAASDAVQVAARLREETRPLYTDVVVYGGHALTDTDASLPNLLAGLDWLRKTSRPSDTVVVFLSGHGFSSGDGKYFFPTYAFDNSSEAAAEATSLAGAQLADKLATGLAARSVFLLVDSCHAGALDGARSDDLSFDLDTSGVYMMASSGSSQSSYESPNWGHGAFTSALLTCLSRIDLMRPIDPLAPSRAIRFDMLTYAVPAEIARLLAAAGQNASSEVPVIPLEERPLDVPIAVAR